MNLITKSLAALAVLGMTSAAIAEPVKVGMITTLSGGGASLGIDARDGFMLAIKQSGNKDVDVVIEDDQRKPDVAVQIADKMIQSDKVDILTGIIWSNLAMAVVPAAVAQGKFYLSVNAAPSQLAGKGCNAHYFSVSYQNDNLHEAAGAYATDAGYKNTFILAPNYPAGKDSLTGFKRFYKGELAGEVYTQLGQTDYAAEIAQIRASGRRQRILLPAGRHGHRLHEAVCPIRRRHPDDRTGFLVRPGYPAGCRRCGAWRQEHRQLVEGHRQRGQQGIRGRLSGGI